MCIYIYGEVLTSRFYKGLVTNYREGGYKTGGVTFTTTKRGGGGSFSHAEGGGAQKVLG